MMSLCVCNAETIIQNLMMAFAISAKSNAEKSAAPDCGRSANASNLITTPIGLMERTYHNRYHPFCQAQKGENLENLFEAPRQGGDRLRAQADGAGQIPYAVPFGCFWAVCCSNKNHRLNERLFCPVVVFWSDLGACHHLAFDYWIK